MIRLVSWNLHRCIGHDGIMSAERCAAVMREIDADIYALQEVESLPGHELDALALLARETGTHIVSGATMYHAQTHYGNALLSRLPAAEERHHNISVQGREPRAVIDTSFEINQQHLQIITTHLGLSPSERRFQVERLLTMFKIHDNDVVILAGDLNEWFLWGRPLRKLHRIFPDTPHRRSWPAKFPLFALDRIWVHPRSALVNLSVHQSELARQASDHLPLVATIEL